MMAVIVAPSALLFITSSHSVVITSAGASARVRSATNTISGFRTTTLISILDAAAGATTRKENREEEDEEEEVNRRPQDTRMTSLKS